MNRGKAGFDRIITFLLVLVFAAPAAWGIGLTLDADYAHRVSSFLDRDFWAGLPERDGYGDILRIAAIILFVLGLLLIVVNIERKRLGKTTSPRSGTAGVIRIHPADIASAAAQTLQERDDVRSATCRAVEDRSTDIVEIRLRVPAEVDIAGLRAACTQAAADIRAAVPGQDIRPRFLIEAEQVRHTH